MKLPDTELEVMQALWACPVPVSREMINEKLQQNHPMAQTTLLTILSRLEKKEVTIQGFQNGQLIPQVIEG